MMLKNAYFLENTTKIALAPDPPVCFRRLGLRFQTPHCYSHLLLQLCWVRF